MGQDVINAIKIILIIVILALIIFPIIPFKLKVKNVSTSQGLKYVNPHHKKNFPYVFLLIAEFIVIAIAYAGLKELANLILKLDFMQSLIVKIQDLTSSQVEFIIFVILAMLVNLLMIYGSLILKTLLKKFVLDPTYKFAKSPKKVKKTDKKQNNKNENDSAKTIDLKEENKSETTDISSSSLKDNESEIVDENSLTNRIRIRLFKHSKKEDEIIKVNKEEQNSNKVIKQVKSDESYTNVKERRFCNLFFEREGGYIYPHPYIIRARTILQIFIWLVEIMYVVFFAVLLISIFYPLKEEFYKFFTDIMHIQEWYIYPFISVLILQEIVNTLNGPAKPSKKIDEEKQTEEEKVKDIEYDIRDLQVQLIKRFDKDHTLRFFPELPLKDVKQYQYTNLGYKSALDFIANHMQTISGRVVQSYMEIIDALFGNNNVYFGGSFYSEIGEYLISYAFTRLIAGSRVIFVCSDPDKLVSIKQYINQRLIKLSNLFSKTVWRVRTADERLDQADVLIACPDDFKDDSIVINNSVFFEEVVNVIFMDSDRMIEMKNYLCTIMAMRIQSASKRHLSYIFLSEMIYRGFTESNLPRFFNCDNILSFSSAEENECVSYVLWNKESKSNRIYNISGQKLNSVECIIAQMAYDHNLDGIKIFTQGFIDRASSKVLLEHSVEINEIYKEIPDVNYVIYADDGYNLAASLYSCTRFRGKYKSIVNIISKPYLLREYFMYKVSVDDYINRSPFIQPHVTEHVDYRKLSLLKIYLSCTGEISMPINKFVNIAREALTKPISSSNDKECPYCQQLRKQINFSEMNYIDFCEYLIAGLCDDEDTPIEESYGKRAKDYYIISNQFIGNGYDLVNKKDGYISFKKTKEVLNKVLSSNKTVSLYLNDRVIGTLDTFPNRVPLEYIPGQSIVYKNVEYEISSISSDYCSIFLRHENVVFQNTYQTLFLRRYKNINLIDKVHPDDVLTNSHSNLCQIKVSRYNCTLTGETYGYYTIMSDHQFLDLANDAEGNILLDDETIKKQSRNIEGSKVLKLTLTSRNPVNDAMRLLLGAVFNEFIPTLFPHSYKCIAICPILENPIVSPTSGLMSEDFNERVKTLYPFIEGFEEEQNDHELNFLFINDCDDDVGVLNWFDDRFGHYMEEFIANVYSYLHWLKDNITLKHYIYFGGESLPSVFDLDGCCELLSSYNYILSDEGKKQFETAGHDSVFETTQRCSFCHHLLESGRYQQFDDNRLICNDCASSAIFDLTTLGEVNNDVLNYLFKTYPEIIFAFHKAEFMEPLNLNKEQFLSENLYYIDTDKESIFVERDDPLLTASISLLRGHIEFWQVANNLLNPYSLAQLYYEELVFLRNREEFDQANWVYENLNEEVRNVVDDIARYTGINITGEYLPDLKNIIDEFTNSQKTSFSYLREKAIEIANIDNEEEIQYDQDYSDSLYDPDKTPRFWKRYLYGKTITEGEDKIIDTDDSNVDDIDENINDDDDSELNNDMTEETVDNESDSEDNDQSYSEDISESNDDEDDSFEEEEDELSVEDENDLDDEFDEMDSAFENDENDLSDDETDLDDEIDEIDDSSDENDDGEDK